MKSYEFIAQHQMLIDHFGQWPDFHDAEVHSLTLHRPAQTTAHKLIPTLELKLRCWILKDDVAATGFYTLHGDTIVHFLFEGIFDLQMEGFNNQNVLSSMNLQVVSEKNMVGGSVLKVELEHCYEFEASFKARTARIMSITPYV